MVYVALLLALVYIVAHFTTIAVSRQRHRPANAAPAASRPAIDARPRHHARPATGA